MIDNLMIKDIPNTEKPRERLLKYGVENISTADLIAIILKTGTKSYSVKYLAAKVLSIIDTVDKLKDLTINHLINIHGIGTVKALELIAAIELGRRVHYEPTIKPKIKLNHPEKIYTYFKYLINDIKQEVFYCLYLDNKKRLIDKRLLFKGTINKSIVHPREIFKQAYLLSASSIICVHNHPSGDPAPSDEDILLTKRLVTIGNFQGIKIVDHIIIGHHKYYSFYEHNKI